MVIQRIYTINPLLKSYVRYYFVLKPQGQSPETVSPDGSLDIEFQLQPGLRPVEKHTVHSRFSQPHQLTPADLGLLLGVSFYPWGLRAFVNFPLTEITNLKLSLENVFGPEAKILQQQVENTNTPANALVHIEKFLLSKLRNPNRHLVQYASVQILKSGGAFSIENVARNSTISERRLEQCFKDVIGVSPKLYARLIRFKKAKRLLTQKKENLARLALECGYYDQSHFIHDFKKFSGTAPLSYLKSRHEIDGINETACLEAEW